MMMSRPSAFTPLGTAHLVTSADRVGALPFGVFLLYEPKNSIPYTACVPETRPTYFLNPRLRELWLEVPALYRERLDDIAQTVFADAKTTRQKIRAAEAYFRENYRYRLGIDVPPGEDPLLYFLRDKPAAHCEYFATAAAMLLRTAGVPSRYVTGYVAAEWNPSGGYWLARNRDAHAWVEAFDEIEGWITVEATPAAGVPSTNRPATKLAWWETLQSDWRRLRTYFAQGRWDRVRELFRSSWVSLPLGLVLVVFVLYLLIRIRGRLRSRRTVAEVLDPELREMQKLLAKMDRLLRPHGLERGPGETLHQFARRVRRWRHWRFPQHKETLPSREPPPFAERAAGWYDGLRRFPLPGPMGSPDASRASIPLSAAGTGESVSRTASEKLVCDWLSQCKYRGRFQEIGHQFLKRTGGASGTLQGKK